MDLAAVEGTPAYPVNDTDITSIQFWYIDLARGVSGAVSLLVCSLILFLILLHKAYASLLQRFLLYLTVGTLVAEATFTMQIEHLVKYTGQWQFCQTLAFLDQFGSTIVVVFSLEITILLVFRVYESLQRQCLAYDSWSKICRVSLEVTAVCLAILISLATSVVPLIQGTYGLNAGWCWITAVEKKYNSRGFWDQNTLATIPYAILGLVIGIFIVLVIVLFCISAFHSSTNRRLNFKMIRDNLILLAFYFVFFIVLGVEMSVQLVSGTTHSYANFPVWLAYAIGIPIAKLVLPLGFLFYMYTIKKITLGSFEILRRKCYKCCSCFIRTQPVQAMNESNQGYVNVTRATTYRSSHPQVYPSETVTSPLYTGAFTSITRRDSSDEKRALLSHRDTGYSSHYGTSETKEDNTD